MCLALLTILMGSTMAFKEKVIKKRLAYSSVSQISYVLFSLSLLSEDGLRGGLLQVISHMSSKGCLFLAAGVFIIVLGAHHVEELKGIGRALPVTMWCFMFAALSLVGIPPMGGFVSCSFGGTGYLRHPGSRNPPGIGLFDSRISVPDRCGCFLPRE